jgi:hypothetical protein
MVKIIPSKPYAINTFSETELCFKSADSIWYDGCDLNHETKSITVSEKVLIAYGMTGVILAMKQKA